MFVDECEGMELGTVESPLQLLFWHMRNKDNTSIARTQSFARNFALNIVGHIYSWHELEFEHDPYDAVDMVRPNISAAKTLAKADAYICHGFDCCFDMFSWGRCASITMSTGKLSWMTAPSWICCGTSVVNARSPAWAGNVTWHVCEGTCQISVRQ